MGSEKDVSPVAVTSPAPSDSIGPVHRVKWYRSTFYNALVLGICNFLAPGIWGAMNSLGGGGQAEPYLVNAANALTFALMVVSCFFGSVIVRFIGIKWTLIVGTMGFAPYAAGLYLNNRYSQEWLVLLGAALCGISAGLFWMAEAAIALSYPEPYNQGRFLGFWLSFRVGGQILGGAISLGINVKRSTSGSVSYTVYLIFIALQALAPFAGLLLNNPSQVQRKDRVPVQLQVTHSILFELKSMAKLWINRKFLYIVPFICSAVYSEAVMFSYQGLWFSVRARALGSLLSGIIALVIGNVLGAFLDNKRISLKSRTRYAFFFVVGWLGMCWIWGSIVTTDFNNTHPVYDWTDPDFGRAFTLFLFWVAGFQLSYMYLYFVVGNLADDHEEIVRISGLLRGTESAAQCVSYGLSSVRVMAAVGSVYLNFGLWALATLPAWLIVKEIGVAFGDKKISRETGEVRVESSETE
ncbi:Major facilitator superfamily domain general substrate transporter [Penicillium sp. DV-2018c]|nr:Major facilitator superfamily domain general substrate transporter [Penicillium sp. DV-2018c]KAJ5565722.1 Major facilitator superfamily domain general substrate transporter [Penicillium sp. DV-2018c]